MFLEFICRHAPDQSKAPGYKPRAYFYAQNYAIIFINFMRFYKNIFIAKCYNAVLVLFVAF